MRVSRTAEESEGSIINLAPLVDVMFILIIFFLAATTFKQQEFDLGVNLPDARGPKTISAATKLIVINVHKDGRYVVANRPMSLKALRQTVQKAVANDPNQKVLLRGDQDARHGYVAAAVAVCHHAGILHPNIGYDHKLVEFK